MQQFRASAKGRLLTDGLFTLLVLIGTFMLNLLLQSHFKTHTMTPMLFVLGVFLVSWRTQGYFWGLGASLLSVLAVNWAFTYPYWAVDLISPECITAAAVMLTVATVTCTLTTRLKQQEKIKAEAEKERMRSNLLRAVSHDLRTPLTSIYGACSVLMENFDELSPEKKRKMLRDVCADAQWLTRMVENLLSVTRVDADTVRLSKHSTVLEELIDALLVKFRKHYPDQKVTVQIPETFVSIPMDAMLIEQVLMNLLENAVFHARGMTRLMLTVECRDNLALFRVEDDGCGIDPDRLDTLFTGSMSRETSTDTTRSNMGIGLSVCSTIVKAHGSEIRVASRPGGGAVFSFTLEMEDNINVEQ